LQFNYFLEIIKFREEFLKQSSKPEKKFVELLVVADNSAVSKVIRKSYAKIVY